MTVRGEVRMNNLEEQAWEIANRIHKNCVRKVSNKPYITHIQNVVNIINKWDIRSPTIIIPAILHDSVEGSKERGIIIKEIGQKFGEYIKKVVLLLTHDEGYDYMDYIKELSDNRDATIVKIADILDNLTDNPTVNQKLKYKEALVYLLGKKV